MCLTERVWQLGLTDSKSFYTWFHKNGNTKCIWQSSSSTLQEMVWLNKDVWQIQIGWNSSAKNGLTNTNQIWQIWMIWQKHGLITGLTTDLTNTNQIWQTRMIWTNTKCIWRFVSVFTASCHLLCIACYLEGSVSRCTK